MISDIEVTDKVKVDMDGKHVEVGDVAKVYEAIEMVELFIIFE